MSKNPQILVIVVPEALADDYADSIAEYADALGVTVDEARPHADAIMAQFAIRRLRRQTKVYSGLGKRMGWS